MKFLFFHTKQAKINDLLDQIKTQILNESVDLIIASDNLKHCIDLMTKKVDKLVVEYVEKDSFVSNIPTNEKNKLKESLKPIFKKLYVIKTKTHTHNIYILFF